MKKLFSLLLAVCMIATFMVTASAAEAGIKADVVETETGATVTISLTAAVANIGNITLYVPYNQTKLTYVSAVKGDKLSAATTWTEKNSDSASYKWYKLNFYSTDANKSDLISLDANDILYTVTFEKNAAIEDSDIVLVDSNKVSAVGKAGNLISADKTYDSKNGTLDLTTTFTPYKPVVEDKVVTFEKVYSEGKTAVVFGKALEGAVEAGVYFAKDGAALEHSTAMAKTEKGAGYFPAYTSDITKAFGVQIQDLEAGEYAAKVYSDDAFGSEVTFAIQ